MRKAIDETSAGAEFCRKNIMPNTASRRRRLSNQLTRLWSRRMKPIISKFRSISTHFEEYSPKQLKETITQIEADMRFAASEMKFERAAELRDKLEISARETNRIGINFMQVKTQRDELENYLIDASNLQGGHARETFYSRNARRNCGNFKGSEREENSRDRFRRANRNGRRRDSVRRLCYFARKI